MLIAANKNYLRLRSVREGTLLEGGGCHTVTQRFSRAVLKKLEIENWKQKIKQNTNRKAF